MAMSDKISVLVVENELDSKVMIESVLVQELNLNYVFVENIVQAIDIIKAGYIPQVAIVDLKIPKDGSIWEPGSEDGYDLAREIIKLEGGRTRVVITSDLKLNSFEVQPTHAWGYFWKMNDWEVLARVALMGPLKDSEVGNTTIDLQSDFGLGRVENRW